MLDARSVNSLIESFPSASQEMQNILFFTQYAQDAFAPGCAWEASHGFLGCLPFAAVGKDRLAIRLLPGYKLDKCPLIITWGEFESTEGTTFAPQLSAFVASRLITLDWGSRETEILTPEIRQQLLAYAEKFGGADSCERYLDLLQKGLPKDFWDRKSLLYAQTFPGDPFFLHVQHRSI